MKMVVDIGDGSRWMQLETVSEAQEEGLLSSTPLGTYFALDERQAGKGHAMPAYYALRMVNESGQRTLVTGRIREAGPNGLVWWAERRHHVRG